MLGLAYAAKLLTGVSAYSSDVSTWTNYYTTQFNNTFGRIQDTDEDAVNYNSIWLDDLVTYVQVTGMNQAAFYSNPNVEQIFYRYMQEATSLGVLPKYGEYSFGETIYAPAMLAAANIYDDGQFTYVAERAWNYERTQPGASNFVGIDTSSANTDYWPVFMFSNNVPAPVAPATGVTYEDQRWGMTFPDKLVFNTGNNGTGTDLLDNLSNGMSHGEQDATAVDGLIYDNSVLLTSPMTQFSSANTAATQDIDTYEEYQNEVLDEPVGASYPELPNVETQLGTGQWMHIVLNLNQGTPENAGGVNLADITSMELRIARGDTDNTGDNYDLYLADVQAAGAGGTLTLADFTNGQAWDGGQIVTTNLPPGQTDALEVPAPTGEFPSFQLGYPVNLSAYSTIQFWMKLTPEPGASGVPLVQFRMDSNFNGDTYSSEWLDWQFDTYHEGPVTQMGSFAQMQYANINSVLDDTQGGDNNQSRSIMVLPNGMVWVRDQVTFGQAESAQIGPVWNVQNILAQGANWFETQQDAQSGQEGETASNLFYANQDNLLVYFVPQTGDQIGDGVSPYASSDTPFGLYQKWSGSASTGQSETFNTLLLANPVGTNAGALASSVQILESDNTATVALVGNDYVVINLTGAAINVGGLQTNAEYLTVQMTGGVPTYLSGSDGSYVILNGKTIYSSASLTANFESYLPTVATAAAANPNPVVAGKSTALGVLGADTNGESNLTYTWSAIGPAAVTYSGNTNGTNAAKSIAANFIQSGSYTFTATITDSGGLSTTSMVTVVVQQTPANIVVSPATSPVVPIGLTQQFSATATDQFGNAISSPSFGWGITGSGNSISSGGDATLGSTPGSFTVTATDGSAQGIATVITENFAVPSGSTLDINLGSAGPVTISASGSNITASQNSVQITLSGFTGITVTDTASNDILNFNGLLALPFTFVNCGSSTVNVNSGTLTFAANMGGTINLDNLSVANDAGAMITAATTNSPTTLSLSTLSIGPTGQLDVANNQVLINYGSVTPISMIANWIDTGYAGGAWNGYGIISSTAQTNPNYGLGYADAADANNPANLPAGEIKIMYTLLGDANLDGTVNSEDFTLFSEHLGQSGMMWDDGDFNYDGTVNSEDFTPLSENLGQSDQIAAAPLLQASPVAAAASTPAATVPKDIVSTVLGKHEAKKKPRYGS